ncbi:hypothetical protein GCM10012285_65940 [Streptomyces kronopolitis]|uniref:Uncharacterized protein n=1 Tax=Streptomyces kronopolitis TaxID=1612435 RepID=A0ABQ2K264_9ACTN|nr:hypothetical protein [Streptomyces kronopolitis]GGN64157.1 hypothetical protein GCM10012285_65940 [Streptomyces kronopolitis]
MQVVEAEFEAGVAAAEVFQVRGGAVVGRGVDADETATTHERRRNLDAEIEPLADVVGGPGERTITQRLDTIDRVCAVRSPRAQGITPDAAS